MSVKEMSLYFLGGVPIQYFGLDPIDPRSSFYLSRYTDDNKKLCVLVAPVCVPPCLPLSESVSCQLSLSYQKCLKPLNENNKIVKIIIVMPPPVTQD